MVPGMYGIAAPYWKETAPTEFKGDGAVPSQDVLLRAGMESIAFLVVDILDQLQKIPNLQIYQITAAGGAARPPLLQFQADILGMPIIHSSVTDATALGCAFLTGLHMGIWKDKERIRLLVPEGKVYNPSLPPSQRQFRLDGWHRLLKSRGILI